MLKWIQEFVTSLAEPEQDAEQIEDQLHIAAAVLLVEVMLADHETTETEVEQVIFSLHEIFGIARERCEFLIQEARDKHETLVSLQELTSVINSQQDQVLKRKIIYSMWCIALADNIKDKYEEHLIRKVSDLLYVSHAEFIQARHQAESRYTRNSSGTY